jgi:hypothetical protein
VHKVLWGPKVQLVLKEQWVPSAHKDQSDPRVPQELLALLVLPDTPVPEV